MWRPVSNRPVIRQVGNLPPRCVTAPLRSTGFPAARRIFRRLFPIPFTLFHAGSCLNLIPCYGLNSSSQIDLLGITIARSESLQRFYHSPTLLPGAIPMSGRHGIPLRGLMSTKSSPLFDGFFGRMFRTLHPAKFGNTDQENAANLVSLATAMTAGFDPPKDGKDEEESGIPALYTYLGQFIDHDLTFDPTSSLQKQNDPDALVDFRSPAFDLDNVYGRGPDDQPYMYDGACPATMPTLAGR